MVSTTGKKVQQQDYLPSGEIPIVDQGQDFVGGYTNEVMKRVECDLPVIVFGDHTRIFKFVDFDFVAGADGIKVLKPHPAFHPKLLYYFLQALELPDRGYSRHFRFLRRETLPLPPIPEQNRIVGLLETELPRLGKAISALTHAQTKLGRFRASVLQAACEGRLVPTDAELARREGRDFEPADELLERILNERRARWEEERWAYEVERAKKKAAQAERKAEGLPYYIRELEPEHWEHRTPEEYEPYLPKGDKWKRRYEEPKRLNTDELMDLPEGWAWTNIDALAVGGPQNGLYLPQSKYGEGLPILRIDDYQNGMSKSSSQLRLVDADAEEAAKYALGIDDLVINRVNSMTHLGKCMVVSERNLPSLFESNMMRLHLSTYVKSRFIEFYLRSGAGRVRLTQNAKWAVNQASINQQDVVATPVPLPPLAEQRRIVEDVERRLSIVDTLAGSIESNLTRAERLRQAILKKAFEGRLVRQDPDDEPASKLLERIRDKASVSDNEASQQMPLL